MDEEQGNELGHLADVCIRWIRIATDAHVPRCRSVVR